MKCACKCGLVPSLLVVVGLVAGGLGGYNLITTGCPLGMCQDEAQVAGVTVPVSTTTDKASCPLSDDEHACCPEKSAADRAACCGHDAKAPETVTTAVAPTQAPATTPN